MGVEYSTSWNLNICLIIHTSYPRRWEQLSSKATINLTNNCKAKICNGFWVGCLICAIFEEQWSGDWSSSQRWLMNHDFELANKPYLAPRGFLSKVRPMGSNSCLDCPTFFLLLELATLLTPKTINNNIYLNIGF